MYQPKERSKAVQSSLRGKRQESIRKALPNAVLSAEWLSAESQTPDRMGLEASPWDRATFAPHLEERRRMVRQTAS